MDFEQLKALAGDLVLAAADGDVSASEFDALVDGRVFAPLELIAVLAALCGWTVDVLTMARPDIDRVEFVGRSLAELRGYPRLEVPDSLDGFEPDS